MKPARALEFEFSGDPLAADIDKIHRGTAIYTAIPEVEALLDRLGWPHKGERILDPGAGNGGFLVAALNRLDLDVDDVETASFKVRGYEFHPSAAEAARRAIAEHLASRGWTVTASAQAASQIIEVRDFLLSPVPVGEFDVIAANPPYWRLANLPPESAYRFEFEAKIPPHAKADLLYAYLNKSVDLVRPDGQIGLVTADRWLLNKGSAELRAKIGERFTVLDIKRLESASAFYRPKTRRKGSPARVHPVSLILSPGNQGRKITADPFMIEEMPAVQGRPLTDIATVRLAPWLGPDGIFIVFDKEGLPQDRLIPCVEPENICPDTDTITSSNRWALLTDKEKPEESVLSHLDENLSRMPNRGQREPRWLPPEPFAGKLPLADDAVLIPRIAKKLRPILLPAGTMPVNHNLVVVAGVPAEQIITMLKHPCVQKQADILALRLENGYRSYTATLLRQLIIPDEVIQDIPEAA